MISFDHLDKYLDDLYQKEDLKMEGSLQLVRESNCGSWALIFQPISKEEKWVDVTAIMLDGAMIAFYDADPTFLPESERK